ncbi:MAG: hypothetical protein V3T77_10280, partial [Planctomycetota bacterium]
EVSTRNVECPNHVKRVSLPRYAMRLPFTKRITGEALDPCTGIEKIPVRATAPECGVPHR